MPRAMRLQDISQERECVLRTTRPREFATPFVRPRCQLLSQRVISHEPAKTSCDLCRPKWIEVDSAVSEHFRHRAAARAGDRQARGHRFQQNIWQILATRPENKRIGRMIKVGQVGVRAWAGRVQELAVWIQSSDRAIQPSRRGSVRTADKINRDRQPLVSQAGNRLSDVPLVFVDIED
jgi:hypothetical protein